MNICATVVAVLLSAKYSVILGKSDKIVKPGETTVLGCINNTDDTIWSYRRNINDDRITIMESLAVNPEYKDKVNLTLIGSAGDYCLKLINMSSHDEGIYSCYTPANTFILEFNLCKEAAPDNLIILNKTTDGIIIATEGQMLNITCEAIGGNTKGNIYWRHVSDIEPQITEVDEWPFAYLHLITDYKHHGMNVSCVVVHDILSAEMVASVIVHVLYRPKITIVRYPAGNIEEGQQMKLKCLEQCNPPKTSITWVKDGIFLSSGPVYEKTNMKTNDSGNYSCIVLNSVGKELEYVVILINKSYAKYNDDFLGLQSFLCFGILTLSFLVLLASAICNICTRLHCKKLSRVSFLTVNNDVSRENIEVTDINNGYHTINDDDIRQEDHEVENSAEILSIPDSSSDKSDNQSAESTADENKLGESDMYLNPYCTKIENTVEVHNYETLDVGNNGMDITALNDNNELQRSYENLKF